MDFNVELIVKHRTERDGTTKYLVKWQNYPSNQNTWEPKENFAKGNTVLKEYVQLHGLQNEEWSGSEAEEEENEVPEPNLTTPEQVTNQITKIAKSWRLHPDVQSFPEVGLITVLLHRNHFFVVTNHQHRTLIADGQNWGSGDRKVLKEIEQRLGHALIEYEKQRHENYCGSAAVAIGLVWLRAQATGNWPLTVRPTFSTTLKRTEEQLHKGKKTPLEPGRVPINRQLRNKQARQCACCGKTTNTTHSGHQAHTRLCTRKQMNKD